MPVPKPLNSVSRYRAALRRIGVAEDELATTPPITPGLKLAAGGLRSVFTAMRLAEDPIILQFLKKYDSIPARDQQSLSIEAVALAAEVNVRHLYGSLMVALEQQARNAVRIIAVTSHPKITAARVKYGLRPAGERDRTALDTQLGLLPQPKGPTFIGKAIFGGGGNPNNMQVSDDDDEDSISSGEPNYDRLFPAANAMQEKLIPIRQRMLTGGDE